MHIYFDGIEIDGSYVTGLSYDSKMFNDNEIFTLGATICDTGTIKIVKSSVSQHPSVVSFTENGITKTFNVDNIEEDDYSYTYTLVDDMIKFNFRYDAQPLIESSEHMEADDTKYVLLSEILQDICEKANVTLVTDDFIGADKHITWYDNTITAREYISMIAELNGGYAKIDNGLKLVQLTNGETNTQTIEGTATLTDASNGSFINYQLKGNTTQQTYTGKNLYDATTSQTEYNHVTYSANNMKVYQNGTVSSTYRILFKAITLPAGTYTLCIGDLSGTASVLNVYLYKAGTWTIIKQLQNITANSSTSFTLNEDTSLQLGEYLIENDTYSNFSFSYQIVLGSIEDYNFEPYTGGQASPNPDYPQNIEVVTGRQEIDIIGKNIFDKNTTEKEMGSTKTIIDTGLRATIIAGGTYKHVDMVLGESKLLGKTITISTNIAPSSSNKGAIYLFFGSSTTSTLSAISGASITGSGNQTKTITIPNTFPSGCDRIWILFYGNTDGTGNANDYVDYTNLQVEYGSTATAYVLYQSQTYEVNLGKNLLKYPYYNTTKTENGITFTDLGNGAINVDGTSSDYAYFNFYPNTDSGRLFFSAGTYTFSSNTDMPTGIAFTAYAKDLSGNTIGNAINISGSYSPTITINEDFTIFAYAYVGQNRTIDNYLLQIQIEKGNQATTYSPYFTPIELCKIGDYQDSIKKGTGKNLFDKSTVIDNKGILYASGTLNNDNNQQATDYISIKPSTQYYFGYKTYTSSYYGMAFYDINKTYISGNSLANITNTFTTPNNAYYIRASFSKASGYETNINALMLNEGSTALTYEPYGYKDKWYIEKKIGKDILTGNTSFTTLNKMYYYIQNNMLQSSAVFVKSNYFTTGRINSSGDENNYNQIDNLSNQIRIKPLIDGVTNATTFNTWLSTHNTIVYYVLATPTYPLIDNEELIEQLDTLENGYTYEEQTNITINNNLLNWFITYITNETENVIDIEDCKSYKIGEYHQITRVALDNGLFNPEGNENGSTLYLNENNVYITEQQDLHNIYKIVNGFNYYSVKIGLGNVILYDIGDCISINDGNKNYKFYCQINANYNGSWNGDYHFITGSNQKEETAQIINPEDNYKRLQIKIDRNNNLINYEISRTNILSTNIDENTGEVRRITTTSGFTFNEEGFNIYNKDTDYNTYINNRGTYYRDGNTILSQTTKDGTKTKDLDIFGYNRYCEDNINDDPLFIAVKYYNEDNEEGYGHFYNG